MSDHSSRPQLTAGGEVTRILAEAKNGDAKAAEELLPLVYGELRRFVAHRLAGACRQHTLQPTTLVHEAWLKVSGDKQREWNRRQHLFAGRGLFLRWCCS